MIHSAVDKFHCGWKCHTHRPSLFFLLLVTDINVKFNEHVLMRARHLNLSQKRLQPQLRNALALSIRVSSKFEFQAAHPNQWQQSRFKTTSKELQHKKPVSWFCGFRQSRLGPIQSWCVQGIWNCRKNDFNPNYEMLWLSLLM